MPRLGSDAVGGNSGRNHPTSRRHTIHIGRSPPPPPRVACNASVGTRESYNIVRLPGWYGERVLFITSFTTLNIAILPDELPAERLPMRPQRPIPCRETVAYPAPRSRVIIPYVVNRIVHIPYSAFSLQNLLAFFPFAFAMVVASFLSPP